MQLHRRPALARATGNDIVQRLARSIGLALPVLTLTVIVGQPVLAQDEDTDSADEIVVTGSQPTTAEMRRNAVEFVNGTGVALGERPAARWVDPVCPRAFGLPKEYNRIVVAKLRAVAEQTGVPVAREPCRANVMVSFTHDAAAVARKIAARAPHRLAEVPADARTGLLNGTAPVRWWYGTDLRSRDGMRGAGGPAPWTGGNNEGGGGSAIPENGNASALLQYSSSLVSTQAVRALTSATIIIDAKRAEGVPLHAVASYAALVAFAEVRPTPKASPSSVLSLFEGGAKSLTEWDTAFLRELYSLPLDRTARRHRGRLVSALLSAQSDQGGDTALDDDAARLKPEEGNRGDVRDHRSPLCSRAA